MLKPLDGDRDRVGYTSGQRALVGAGSFLLLCGSFLLVVLLQSNAPPGGPPSAAPPWPLLVVAAAIVGASVIMMGWRTGLALDRRRHTGVTWWGVLFPWSSREASLKAFTHVTIDKVLVRGNKSSYFIYPVALAGDGGQLFKLVAPTSYDDARQTGETVAKFLQFALHDSSSGALVVREAGRLDETLCDRLRRTGEVPGVPEVPEGLRTQVDQQAGQVTLSFAPPPVLAVLMRDKLLSVAVPVLVSLDFTWVALAVSRLVPLTFLIAYAVVSLGGTALLVLVIRARAMRTVRVVATPAGLQFHTFGWFRAVTVEMPVDQLEELNIQQLPAVGPDVPVAMRRMLSMMGVGIEARSDRRAITFGAGLADEELRYLHALLVRAMLG